MRLMTLIFAAVVGMTPVRAQTLDGIGCATITPKSGTPVTCTIYLKAAAAQNVTGHISSDSGWLHAPATVTIPAGRRSAAFTVATDATTHPLKGVLTVTVDRAQSIIFIDEP